MRCLKSSKDMGLANADAKGRRTILETTNNLMAGGRYVTSGLNELRSKAAAPTSDWSAMVPTDHFVQFYERDGYIVNSVAEYIFHGLTSGETCIVIATTDHKKAIESELIAFGIDPAEASDQGSYVSLDAEKTVAKFMAGDQPDARLFQKTVGDVVQKAAKRGPVRAFGEMVAVLVHQGKPAAAVELEKLWNALRKRHDFSLFCAYPTSVFASGEAASFMSEICSGHSRVIPDESYTSLTSADERLRKIAFLQQRQRQLEGELVELRQRNADKGGGQPR